MERLNGINEEKFLAETIRDGILEIGSILVGRELTIDEAYEHFRKIDPKKEKLINGSEYDGFVSRGCRLIKK